MSSPLHACRGCGAVQAHKICAACAPKYACLQQGVEAARRGDASSALMHYQQALSLDPDFGHAHNNLGNLYNRRDDATRAAAAFERAVAVAPADAQTRLNLAATRDLLGDARALDDVEAALLSHPGTLEDLVCDGNAWIREQLASLCARCQSRIAGDDADARAHLVLGLARQVADEGGAPELERALELTPDDPDVLVAVAGLRAFDDAEAASALLERALAVDPAHALALTRRADARRLGGDESGARADYEAALRAAPRDWPEIPELESWIEELS